MTDHTITPPPELVASMIEQAFSPLGATGLSDPDQLTGAFADLVTRAAQWGADQELEACISWMRTMGYWGEDGCAISKLRAARRPNPPSLKEQALEIVRGTPVNSAGLYSYEHVEIIRRALEQLND